MQTVGRTSMSGALAIKVVRSQRAVAEQTASCCFTAGGSSVGTARWRIRNTLRLAFIWGWLAWHAAHLFTRLTGIPCMVGRLSAILTKADGTRINLGALGYRVVTDAFVAFMVDELQAETAVWGDFKYHDSGVGTTAEAAGDTDMETTDGESRVAGSQIEGATANIYKSVGTIAYTTTKAITEHGVFSTLAAATLMDRTVFAAVNVVNGDSIQFTYELTCTAGS